jgi:hypothetical protein
MSVDGVVSVAQLLEFHNYITLGSSAYRQEPKI